LADYKRMISYMYQYENGVKKKNVGYARVEVKSGQSKITLHMQLLGQLDSIFPTYLIQRDENGMELIYLGDSLLKNQVMDSKLSSNEVNIMDSGHNFTDVGGVLLFLNEDIFYATEWDDKPIVAKDVMEALKPKKISPQKGPDMLKEEGQTVADLNAVDEVESSTLKKKKQQGIVEESKTEEKKEEHLTKKEPEHTEEPKQNREESTSGDTFAEKKQAEEVPKPEETPSEPILAGSEAMLPKYRLPGGFKTIERMQNMQSPFQPMNKGQSAESVKEDAVLKNIIEEAMIKDEEAVAEETVEEQVSPQVRSDTSEDSAEAMRMGYEKSEDVENPTAAKIFANYPRIYPFEDNEVTFCVKIEPKDIGFLPMSYWGLSNNSFLMHGFYCYHHLIFAKLKDRFGCRYILGVPGIYHNREQFMARMFGFDCFKSIRKRELRQGDFGYWFLAISL